MARLPQPGGDSGNWGDILNDYLSQSHKTDGAIKDNAVTSATIAPGAVTSAAIATNAVTSAALAPDSVTATQLADNSVNAAIIVDGSVTEAQLDTGVQTKLNAAPTIADGSIAKAKLATAVQTSLDKADAAAATYAQFKELARTPELLIAGAITRDANGAATTAPVVWPDGTVGTYTADTLSATFLGAVDAYHISYGSPVTKTYTQPAITRDANGIITNLPAITVS